MRNFRRGEEAIHRGTKQVGRVIHTEPLISRNRDRYPNSDEWILVSINDYEGITLSGPNEFFAFLDQIEIMPEPDFSLDEINLAENLIETD